MTSRNLARVFKVLREVSGEFDEPLAQRENRHRDPFRVTVGVLMSSRTKDDTTGPAVERLFKTASTPEKMAALSVNRIEELIFPVGFYHTKARHIKHLAMMLVDEFGSTVPQTMEELLRLPGIGRKSANLISGVAFGIPSICVDTHVHRITNRWGYVKTANPYETEMALRERLPGKYWIEINRLLVVYGQNICTPISPFCSRCRLEPYCDKEGVSKTR